MSYVGQQVDTDPNTPANVSGTASHDGLAAMDVVLWIDDGGPRLLELNDLAAEPTPTTLVDGTVAVTTTPAALGSQAAKAVLLQADPDNTVDIFVGDATNQRFQLLPGQWLSIPVSNASAVYVKTASSTATCNWLAVN